MVQPRTFLWFPMLMLLALAGCSKQQSTPREKKAVPVSVTRAGLKDVPVVLQAVGQVEASSTVTLRSRVAGVIAAVHFREGDEVRPGEDLFTLDQRPFQAALDKAAAELRQQQAAAANARREAERYATLLASGFVSREEADTAQANADSLAAAVAAGQASVENARIQLDYCTVRAPQGGRTGALLVHPGTVVKANDLPDLVTINTIQPIRVNFSVPERNLAQVRRQLARGPLVVSALAQGDGQSPEQGTLDFFDNAVDPATGTIRLKGTFRNSDRRLWPGQFVTVKVVLSTLHDAVTVPTAAVQSGQQGTYLFVVDAEGRAHSRAVTAGIASGDETVIARGLAAGETVVTDGQQRLFPGALVAVTGAPAASQVARP